MVIDMFFCTIAKSLGVSALALNRVSTLYEGPESVKLDQDANCTCDLASNITWHYSSVDLTKLFKKPNHVSSIDSQCLT